MSSSTARPSLAQRFRGWLPTAVDRRVRVLAWLSLIGNIVIIGTGGAVRLTDSGLGCEFALFACSTDSFFASDGVHSIIEQSNRGMGVVLGLISIIALAFVWRLRESRRDLWVHAWLLFGGVVVQGIVGPLSILVNLDAVFVGIHFVLSAILVGIGASFVICAFRSGAPRERAVPVFTLVLAHLSSLLLAATVVLGVITTANGPHSGDSSVVRDTSNWGPVVHAHAYLGYALAVCLILLLASAVVLVRRSEPGARRFLTAVIVTIVTVLVQIAIGLTQADNGIPPLLVGVHMVMAAIIISVAVLLVSSTKREAVRA